MPPPPCVFLDASFIFCLLFVIFCDIRQTLHIVFDCRKQNPVVRIPLFFGSAGWRMSEHRKPKAMHMKKYSVTRIHLSGTVGKNKYRIGVANPCYYRRRGPAFGPKHLRALRALITFLGWESLDQQVVIEEDEFARHFPEKDGVQYLKSVLFCWLRITMPSRMTETATFASMMLYQTKERRSIITRLNSTTVDLLRKLAANE